MQKHCLTMKDHKGKTTGIMMEGSAMHMSMLHKETDKQEKKDLLEDMPVDDKASAMEMSPYKMGHESPAKMGHESPAKNVNKGYGYEVPKPSVAKMGHESPAKFTGMSGGSALHQDADLSDMANLLFSKKKITKKQADKAKKQVEENPTAKDTLKTKKEKKVETKK